VHVAWDARWRDKPPTIEVRLPGRDAVVVPGDAASVAVT
jgi:hypothetical protein